MGFTAVMSSQRRRLGGASDCVDVMLEISARASKPLKDAVRVRVHYGSGNVPAHIALGSGKELAVGDRVVGQLRLEAPVFLCAGDHLTIRDWSEQQTLAGAIVLDPDATRRAFRATERQQWLQRVAESLESPTAFVAAYVARDVAIRRSRAFVKTRFSKEDIDAAIERLVREGTVVVASGRPAGRRGDVDRRAPASGGARRRRASRAPGASRFCR